MEAGNGKSSDFRLSQALANQVVRKGVCGDFILCGLSSPVSASRSLVHRYTFWPLVLPEIAHQHNIPIDRKCQRKHVVDRLSPQTAGLRHFTSFCSTRIPFL